MTSAVPYAAQGSSWSVLLNLRPLSPVPPPSSPPGTAILFSTVKSQRLLFFSLLTVSPYIHSTFSDSKQVSQWTVCFCFCLCLGAHFPGNCVMVFRVSCETDLPYVVTEVFPASRRLRTWREEEEEHFPCFCLGWSDFRQNGTERDWFLPTPLLLRDPPFLVSVFEVG